MTPNYNPFFAPKFKFLDATNLRRNDPQISQTDPDFQSCHGKAPFSKRAAKRSKLMKIDHSLSVDRPAFAMRLVSRRRPLQYFNYENPQRVLELTFNPI